MPHVTIEIDQPTAEAIATMAAAGEPVRLRADLRRGGIDHHLVRCGEPYLSGVRHFFATRGLLGRAAR